MWDRKNSAFFTFWRFIMSLEEKFLRREEIFEGRILHVVKDTVSLPNGKEAEREVALHIGGVAIVAMLDNGDILMERQYRYPHGRVFFEIPAGKLDYADEDVESAARRELREETGAIAGDMTYLGEIATTPALMSEKIHLFFARQITFTDRELDEDEFLDVERIPLGKLYSMVMNGKITDAKTQIAILKVYAMLNLPVVDL